MSVNAIVNRVVAEVLKVLAGRIEHTRMGIVDGYDPNTHTARVRIQPENTLTGWLPIHVKGVGQGWGMYFPPAPGDQVHVSHLEGDVGSGQVTGIVNDDDHPPPAVPSREFWLIHQSGSSLKFTNDGKVALVTNSDFNVTVGGKMIASANEFDLTGDVKITGALTATKEGTFNGGHTVSAHTHGGVTTGSGNTATPTG